jgi:hypothetical protein
VAQVVDAALEGGHALLAGRAGDVRIVLAVGREEGGTAALFTDDAMVFLGKFLIFFIT